MRHIGIAFCGMTIAAILLVIVSLVLATELSILRAKTTGEIIIQDESAPDIWSQFVEALIQVESSGRENAIGDNGNSIGVLQLQKIYIDEIGRISGYKYPYSYRFDRDKSIEIFLKMQELKNPNKNIIRAIEIHNPRAGDDYYAKIFKEMFKL